VSIKPLFVKMARLARDVSVKTGKGIDFFKEGEETEIDKSFVEKLSDPLVHMIRNSVDHGIESTEERRRLGKAENGRITLRAFQRAGRFYLELSDDGKGLDTEVILRKAIERGLVREGARMDKEAIERLILEPGFSTAQQVTELSGRGVGMDVVRQAIEGLGGSLGIQSEKGKGTRFTISLPLTLAIVNGMLVQAGPQYLIVPTLSIVECVNPREGQVQEVGDDGHLLELRGRWLHLMRLTDAMGIAAPPTPFTEGVAVIVEDGLGQSMALFVDALLGGQQVVAKPLGDAVPVPEGVQGGAVGGDGKVRLILDVALLLSRVYAKKLRKEIATP
jgi:two-component system, chemotaxis family, sensor kinase CheA